MTLLTVGAIFITVGLLTGAVLWIITEMNPLNGEYTAGFIDGRHEELPWWETYAIPILCVVYGIMCVIIHHDPNF